MKLLRFSFIRTHLSAMMVYQNSMGKDKLYDHLILFMTIALCCYYKLIQQTPTNLQNFNCIGYLVNRLRGKNIQEINFEPSIPPAIEVFCFDVRCCKGEEKNNSNSLCIGKVWNFHIFTCEQQKLWDGKFKTTSRRRRRYKNFAYDISNNLLFVAFA